MFDINMGKFATDQVSGFSGIINGRILRDSGNIQYSIKSKVGDDGKMSDGFYVDADYLIIDEEKSIESKYGQPEFLFSNGEKVASITTPFKGHINACAQSINGCLQYCVTSLNLEKGVPVENWFDETELKSLKKPIKRETRITGGPDQRSHL